MTCSSLKLNDRWGVKSSFYDFLEGGTLLKFFHFSYLSCFWLYLRVATSSLNPLCKRCGLWTHCCLTSTRASVIPEIVDSFFAFEIPSDTGFAIVAGKQRGRSKSCTGSSPMSVVSLGVSATAEWKEGVRVMGASAAGGMGSQGPVPLLPSYLCYMYLGS